ncbi:MAG TPA: histidine kinase [Mycobacteriales bacterium]|nr:histidine kinase [Mycobacteriales bacterium]
MPPRAESVRRVLDVVVPVGVALFQAMVVLGPDRTDGSWLTLLGVAAAAISGAALVWRHHRPVLALAVAAAGGVVLQLLTPETIFPVAALVAMWSLAVARPPLWSLPGLAVVLGVTALSLPWAPAEDVWFGMAVAVAVWALAEAVRSRRQAIVEASRRAVGEEQARIARELHDVIAHSVSVIVVQAAAADDVFDARPDQARSALRSIEAAGREALGELRHLLGAGVSGAGPAAGGSSRPGLAELAELTVPLRAAGLEVAVHDSSRGRVLPAAVDLSAYRIVQEALTNTLRHAHATRASVTIREVGGALEVDVSDDGNGTGGGAGTGGRGLTGMRERAALLGGTLDAGPLPDGGFRVRAWLPLEPAR